MKCRSTSKSGTRIPWNQSRLDSLMITFQAGPTDGQIITIRNTPNGLVSPRANRTATTRTAETIRHNGSFSPMMQGSKSLTRNHNHRRIPKTQKIPNVSCLRPQRHVPVLQADDCLHYGSQKSHRQDSRRSSRHPDASLSPCLHRLSGDALRQQDSRAHQLDCRTPKHEALPQERRDQTHPNLFGTYRAPGRKRDRLRRNQGKFPLS